MRSGLTVQSVRRQRRVPAGRRLRRARTRAGLGAGDRRGAVEHVDRVRRRADPEGLPPARGGGRIRSSSCCASSPTAASRTSPRSAAGTRTPGGPVAATLGILQEFVPDATRRLGARARRDRARAGAVPRAAAAPRRGDRRAAHRARLRPGRSGFAPEEPSVESLGLLTATVDEEIAQVFLSLPEDDERLAPIAGRGEEVREQLRMLTHAGTTGKTIRIHGDFHLGQTLWDGDDWVIIDFEGEPARSLAERRRKRSPLRDVAGMLRSFAYAVDRGRAAARRRGAGGLGGSGRASGSSTATSRPSTRRCCRAGTSAIERLLAVFELEKAVYELRYELDNRPDWVGIPVAAIQRLIEPATARIVIELGPDPHAFLGAHEANGRRRRPRVPSRGAGGARAAGRRRGGGGRGGAEGPGGPVGGAAAEGDAAARVRARGRVPGREHVHAARPVLVPARRSASSTSTS